MNQDLPIAPARRAFVKSTCLAACHIIGAVTIAPLLSSCSSTKYVAASRKGSQLDVPLSSLKDYSGKMKRYIVLEHESLKYPVVLYVNKPGVYSAFHMKCTHQGQELQAAGEYLVCNAHGSEFDSSGIVKQGPATQSLAPLSVQELNDTISITL